jgi:uncharacterized protein with von Willebrand factor type A (vWA) domain
VVREIIGPNRMFPLTIEGLDGAGMRELSRYPHSFKPASTLR